MVFLYLDWFRLGAAGGLENWVDGGEAVWRNGCKSQISKSYLSGFVDIGNS